MKMVRCLVGITACLALVIALGDTPGSWAGDKTKDKKGALTFEIYKDAKEAFRWRLKAANGQVIASSGQGYKAKADCEHGIDIIKQGAATAKVQEGAEK